MAKAERSFAAVPEPESDDVTAAGSPQKRGGFDLPDGALGILFLLVLSSICGALIALYWPFNTGGTEGTANDRFAALESKVDEIAAGHASGAAAQVFLNQRREISALKSRLDADEARVAAVEKSDSTADATDVAGLEASTEKSASDVKQLYDRVARLEQSSSPPSAQAIGEIRTKALHDQLSSFEQRVAVLEKSAPPAGLAQRLDSFALKSEEDALETRVLQLETHDVTGVMRRAAAVMALADLVRATAGGEPFVDELAALKSLAPASPEIQDLARYANKGVPTRTMLADSFSHQANAILDAERGTASKTWSDRIWSRVASVVSGRQIGNTAGNDPQSHVARAEIDLNIGELARAVHEVSTLSGPAREAATPWLKSAGERMSVDRDARALAQRLVADLSAPSSSAQTPQATAPSR